MSVLSMDPTVPDTLISSHDFKLEGTPPPATPTIRSEDNTHIPDSVDHKDDLEQQTKEVGDGDAANRIPPPTGIRRFLILFGLTLGCFLASIDGTIVAPGLPRISSEFNSQSQMAWIATGYLLAYTAILPLYGRFSDIFGLKTMYLLACLIFLIGSAGSGAATSMIMLIIFRAIQGIGGSGLFSLMMIMISVMFDDIALRARYQLLGWVAYGVAGVAGPLLGGVMIEHSTWRWCFYLNLPIGAVSFLLVAIFYTNQSTHTDNVRTKLARIDYTGSAIIIAAVLCLLLPLSWGGTTYAWNSAVIIILLCICVVLFVVLVFIEIRAPEPIIPMTLFLNREVTILCAINCITGLTFIGCMFYIPLFFQVVQNASITNSGLLLTPSVVSSVISTGISAALLAKVKDYRIFISLGTVIMTTAIGLFILFDEKTSLALQIIFILIMGIGQGLIFQNCLLGSQDFSEPKELAVVTSLIAFTEGIGGALGVAICSTIMNNFLVSNLSHLPKESQKIVEELNVIENVNAISLLSKELYIEVTHAYAKSFKMLFTILTPIMGITFIISLFIRRRGSLSKRD
ncbi:hypothetical protein FBU30_004918 [Linnemannia zychae]|nr:hypothetical protein FBU30_004918 [Linnemannia zychae]